MQLLEEWYQVGQSFARASLISDDCGFSTEECGPGEGLDAGWLCDVGGGAELGEESCVVG